MYNKTIAIINKSSGAGGFLCPPQHPEHTMSITDYGNRHYFLPLSCVYDNDYKWLLDEKNGRLVIQEAKKILKAWSNHKPTLESEEVQAWILQVLGYFRGCYKNTNMDYPECWDASNLLMIDGLPNETIIIKENVKKIGYHWLKKDSEFIVPDAAHHAGVNLIRKYYPEFTPTKEHFNNAQWGKK